MSIKIFTECYNIVKNLVPARLRTGDDYNELLKLLAFSMYRNYIELNKIDQAYNVDAVDITELSKLADTIDIIYPTGYNSKILRVLVKYYGKIIKNRGTMESIKQMVRILEADEETIYRMSLEEYCDVNVTLIEKGYIGVEIYDLKDIEYARRMLRKVIPAGYKFDIYVGRRKNIYRRDSATLSYGDNDGDGISAKVVELIIKMFSVEDSFILDDSLTDIKKLTVVKLYCWGLSTYGILGIGIPQYNQYNTPVNVPDSFWKDFSMGEVHSLGIAVDGTLWAWGNNSQGAFGNGTMVGSFFPVQVSTDSWKSVLAGEAFSLGIRSDGTLWAWGYNLYGQLGDGTFTNRLTPVQIGIGKWKSVSCSRQCMGIKEDGSLWAWGINNSTFGNGNLNPSNIPIKIGTNLWGSVSCGLDMTLAISTDGTLWATGNNTQGQFGDGTSVGRDYFDVVGSSLWRSVTAGYQNAGGIKDDGTLWMWGANDSGQAGIGDLSQVYIFSQIQVGIDTWICIDVSQEVSLGIKSDGSLWAWGNNSQGQLGDGTLMDKSSPVLVSSEKWIKVVCGKNAVGGLKEDIV